jgi:hypothetical protein
MSDAAFIDRGLIGNEDEKEEVLWPAHRLHMPTGLTLIT